MTLKLLFWLERIRRTWDWVIHFCCLLFPWGSEIWYTAAATSTSGMWFPSLGRWNWWFGFFWFFFFFFFFFGTERKAKLFNWIPILNHMGKSASPRSDLGRLCPSLFPNFGEGIKVFIFKLCVVFIHTELYSFIPVLATRVEVQSHCWVREKELRLAFF